MKKATAFIILASMLTSIISCGTASGAGDDTTAAGGIADSETTTAEPKRQLEIKDFGGYNVRVLTREDGTTSSAWSTIDLVSESLNGEVINDEVFKRNQKICEDYNITIERLSVTLSTHVKQISNGVLAGDDSYDLALTILTNQANLASQGYLYDLKTIDALDLDYECWDKFGNSFTEINGKSMYVMGDINITDNDATYAMLFNKELYADFPDLPDLYKLVSDGDWTLDKLTEISKKVTHDVNGNSKMEWDIDRWGIISQYEYGVALLVGSGNPTVKLNGDGLLEYNLNNERTINCFERIYEFFQATDHHLIADHADYASVDNRWNVLSRGGFKAGRALFFGGFIGNIRLIRDMEADFGILPVPKVDSNQDTYYSMLQSNNATAYSIPTSVTDPERNGLILQALCEASTDTLLPAYYEDTLVRKASRDTESSAMLDIIFANRIVDISNTFTAIGINSMLQSAFKATANNFTSTEASTRESAMAKIAEINEAYKD